ncbi:MAG: GNAT family N-acetyltransferase [Oscillospiraceae bacterium]|nr:GNAT family N-acetyltransferase [Oscillospiraceae bacterium]
MNIEIMNESHFDKVLEMSRIFYASDALDHEVPIDIISDNIKTAISSDNSLDGYVFAENGEIAGFAYVTCYYETEVGGICAQILDLYIDEKFRGRGYATQYFNFVFDKYSYAKRFRLEVVKDNTRAIAVYKRMGFKEISYGQMAIDKI